MSDPSSFLINRTKSFTLPKQLGKKFTIKLICYESDKSIFGVTYNDSRMNGAVASQGHSYNNNGTWSNTTPSSRTITINSGTNCSVKLDYSITIQ